MLRGEIPEVIRPYVCGVSIMALRKPNGSLRPIAVGETVRRLASKIAVDFISEHARVVLEPLQLGVKRSTATVPMRMKLPSLLTLPTRSTRSTGRLCCGLFVFISLRSLRGLTAVIVMIASSSLAPPWRLLRLFPAQGEFNRATLLARFSSRLPSTQPFWWPVLPRRPCTRVGSFLPR